MKIVGIIIIVTIIFFAGFCTTALCKVSKEADKEAEEMFEEFRKQKK